MGLFSIGEHTTTSSTKYDTTNNYTDQSANAGGDNSLAVGNGANVQINNLSEKVASDALDANRDVSAYALASNTAVSNNALNTGLKTTEYALNTVQGAYEVAARENQDTRDAATLAIQSNAGLTGQLNDLTSKALSTAQTPEASSVSKILIPVLVAIAVIFGLFVLTLRKGKS
jgi:hypothetical protein